MNITNDKFILPLVSKDSKLVKNTEVFEKIIGQVEVLKKLSFFVNNYSDQVCFPNLLFTGSQGLGKSFMARKVAQALGRELVEINCSTIKTAEDFVEGVLINRVLGDSSKVVFLDEAHALSQEITDILLTLLEPIDNKSHLNYKNLVIECDFNKINFIFATTDAHCIFKPLLGRCREEIYFCLYTNDELYKILCSYLPNITITCNQDELSYAARGRAREVVSLSQNIAMYCASQKITTFDDNGWEYIKDTFGIHAYGLRTKEIELMKILSETFPLSASNLAIRMGVNVFNIEDEIETRPRELGFIDSGTRGRILTEKGIGYLKTLN